MSVMCMTKLHMLAEIIRCNPQASIPTKGVLDKLLHSPDYCVQKDAIELLRRSDVVESIRALHEAGICRLPHPRIVIEFQVHDKILLEDSSGNQEPVNEPVQEIIMLEEKDGYIESTYSFVMMRRGHAAISQFPVKVFHNIEKASFDYEFSGRDTKSVRTQISASGLAITIAFVLLNMQGIERERHTFTPLNKQREKKGKPKIPEYTYLRIGHVYRADGTRVKYETGRHMPIHLRSAYTRRQRFGKGLMEEKLVFIPSCIVNLSHGGEIKNKPKVVKA